MLSRYVAQVVYESFWDGSSSPVITGITFTFTFHMRCISIVRSLYFKIFSACFLFTFLSAGIATSIDMHVPSLLSGIMLSGLLIRYFCQLALFVPYYGNLNLQYLFIPISVRGHTAVCCTISPHFLTHDTVQFSTHCIMSLCVLFFCQYWTCWYDLFHCLIRLFTV